MCSLEKMARLTWMSFTLCLEVPMLPVHLQTIPEELSSNSSDDNDVLDVEKSRLDVNVSTFQNQKKKNHITFNNLKGTG